LPAEKSGNDGGRAHEWLIHSFIIKIWRDTAAGAAEATGWRGRITHVPGTEKRHVKSFDEIVEFIVPYLREMGVRLNWRWRLRQWLRSRRTPEDELHDRVADGE
jgi:hypothetical protein